MKKNITAAELMAKLNADPNFAASRARNEEAHAKRVADLREALVPLLEALRAAGCAISAASELMRPPYPRAAPWTAAIPVLLEHLSRTYPADARELIARALAVPEAKAAGWSILTGLYRKETEARVRSGLAAAIAATATEDVMAEVIALARDVRLGSSRLLLLDRLDRSKDPQARAALTDLATDPDLVQEIAVILRRRKRTKRSTG